ncbi:MAG: type II-A CRISPR-associated protein Csn2 [Firmicutes bacterium]|nr:type II-A CRISPR-associated protein Csn2 [Bacillota bacterium]
MRLSIKYIDNVITFNNSSINCLEIENKSYFYKIVNDINNISVGNVIEDVIFTDDEYKELNLSNKINIIFDYFNFDFNSKKIISIINKKVNENILINDKDNLSKLYNKIRKIYLPILNDMSLNIDINNDFDLDLMIKLLNITIKSKDNLLDNLFLLIDIEKELNINKIIVFINLKQYLNKNELIELYKYLLYNNIVVLLIDSQSYGICNEYEKKIIIDEELEEYKI